MFRKLSFIFVLVFGVWFFSASGRAQTTTAELSGVATDESGGVLPNVQVVVLNVATGISRSVVSDEKGRYVVPQLAPGSYQVTVTATGFETLVQKGITLTVGQQAVLNLSMKVGAVTEEVTVTAAAPLVDTSSSAVSGVVEQKRIEELPLNGRDFTQLALVQPGIFLARKTDSVGTKGYGTRISMGGARADQTAWLLDGANIKGAATFGIPGSVSGLVLGVDAVQEFQVLTSNYSAEFGHTSGGVVNMVTKSGTNHLHGSLYEYLRNSTLDARNFFDHQKPAFKRNQFGASIGGAIKKDKAFFFGNYEGLRQRLGLTQIAVVPDANVHQGIVPGVAQPLAVAPSTRPFLDFFPMPDGPSVGGGLAQLFASTSQPTDEDYFMVRSDVHATDSQSLFFRFTFDRGDQTNPDPIPVMTSTPLTRARYSTLQYQNILNPRLLATTRVSFNRTILGSAEAVTGTAPPGVFLFSKSLPSQIILPGFSTSNVLGPNFQNVLKNIHNLYEISEDFVYNRGAHAMKFGVVFEKLDMNINGGSRDFGEFNFGSLQAFLTDQRPIVFNVGAPGSSAVRTLRQDFEGFYFQDDWKFRSNLTFNLGLRYEPNGLPTEKWGRLATVRDWRTATTIQNNIPFFKNTSGKNFSPRVGFAWDPKGNGKTAVRGGFGLFYVPIDINYWRTQTYRNPPAYALVSSLPPSVAQAVSFVNSIGPTVLKPTLTSNSFLQLPDWNLKPSYDMQFNLTVERQLPGNLSVSAGFNGGRGVHLWSLNSGNAAPSILVNGRPFVQAGTTGPNPNLKNAAINYSNAQSFYNALQVQVKKRFSHGFQFQSSYTWSRNIDDSTTSGVATDYQEGDSSQPYNLRADRGLSALHVGQNFVTNGIYTLPSLAKKGLANQLIGGWQIAGIFSAASGVPFTVNIAGYNAPDLARTAGRQRPDLVSGRTPGNIILGKPTQWFDPSAFVLPAPGYYGNLGRNTLLGPGLETFDFSVMKNFPLHITEGSHLDFRADMFNLFNRANFGSPAGVVLNGTTRQAVGGAGLISKTVTTSRQLQFGLKLVF